MLREDLIDLGLFIKLLSFKLSGPGDFDHDAGVDLIDEGDSTYPYPMHTGEFSLDIHHGDTT